MGSEHGRTLLRKWVDKPSGHRSYSSAQLPQSGSLGQCMPVFTDTTVVFVHSFLKHQLEDAERGEGPV